MNVIDTRLSRALDTQLEALLTRGGDERIEPLAGPGTRSRYGVLARPEPALASWSSCTASSPSRASFAAGLRLLQTLGSPDSPAGARRWAAHADRQRRTLAQLWGLDPRAGEGIVWAASATDAELLVPLIAAAPSPGRPPVKRVVNLVVGPAEVGRGIVHGAGLRAPFGQGPLHGCFVPGVALGGVEVRVRSIPATLDQPHALAAQLRSEIARARAAGERCILHLVHCTKLGRVLPSPELCAALCEAGGEGGVEVVVDAAQGRIAPATLRAYLERGWLVITSASKFFGAPPFCGCLWIPPARLAALRGQSLPPALAAYFARADLPPSWDGEGLSHACNPGLIARWELGLASMRAYFGLDESARRRWMRAYDRAVHATLDLLELGDARVELDRAELDGDLDDDLDGGARRAPVTRGIYGFCLRDRGGQAWSKARLDALAARLLERERGGQRLGQVVSVEGSAPRLRVAIGAADIYACEALAARVGPRAAQAMIEDRCARLARALRRCAQ